MRRIFSWRLLIPLVIALISCRVFVPNPPTPTSQDQPSPTVSTPLISPSPSATQTSAATDTPLPIPTLTSTPVQGVFEVRFHPDGGLFVGDQVSMEVISPPDVDMNGQQVKLTMDGQLLAQAVFSSYGIGRRNQATFFWEWDTSDQPPGPYQITFSIEPGGPAWTETVTILPQSEMPFPGSQAAWATAESDCCLIHYITGTSAERDLDILLDSLDQQANHASDVMGVELSEPIRIILLPRVLGHGGFAADGIWVSYLDRNYAGSNSEIVFHHEMVHVLDSRLGGELRPTILVEGLAVYLSGGHFKYEPLIPRAAALLPAELGCLPLDQVQSAAQSGQEVCGLEQYLPLMPLVDNFYNAQHEIGYLQAGALVEYMVGRWGWETYSAFYRDIHNQPLPAEDQQEIGGPQYQAINAALIQHFELTFEELEEDFLATLRQQSVTQEDVQDVRLLTLYYDTIRRYQQLMDPSAYFLTAWLPDGEQMRERQIVADYLRQPSEDENLALEALLLSANQHLLGARYEQAESYIEIVQMVLDRLEQKDAQPFAVHPIAQDYFLLVKASRQAGFTPQKITLDSNYARVWANANATELIELQFDRYLQGWQLAASALSVQLWASE
ncbi:MAG TPA: hypothetical protein VLM80_13635 [Anaerolineales bacterium]|nr:hypothetical protein [Anaerolineales bacterium]